MNKLVGILLNFYSWDEQINRPTKNSPHQAQAKLQAWATHTFDLSSMSIYGGEIYEK